MVWVIILHCLHSQWGSWSWSSILLMFSIKKSPLDDLMNKKNKPKERSIYFCCIFFFIFKYSLYCNNFDDNDFVWYIYIQQEFFIKLTRISRSIVSFKKHVYLQSYKPHTYPLMKYLPIWNTILIARRGNISSFLYHI